RLPPSRARPDRPRWSRHRGRAEPMALCCFRLLGRLPLRGLQAIGAALGWFAYALSPRYAARLKENLLASGVCAGDACGALLRAAIAETGKGLAETVAVWFATPGRVRGFVTEEHGWDAVQAARGAGRGVILLTPHLGCFEIAAA